VANTAIVQSQLFKNVFIPPCTEDSGLALGAAACAEWLKHGKMESHSPYLNNWGIENYKPEFSSATLQTIAKEIAGGKIIGVCNGFGETGPRALGNRSILTLADSKSLAQKLSIEKKGREWYRPLAPVALEKNTKYFTGEDTIHPLSKYMLLDFHVSTQKQKELEGAVHADGTARFQTLFKKEENPFLYELLQVLDEKYGIRALINTSFNSKGEPIVHTMEDALLSAKKMQLDGLVLNGKFQEL
jgi:carbamoyltransferase